MKVSDIFTNSNTNIFVVTHEENDDCLEWTIEPTDYEYIPEKEGNYIVKALQVLGEETQNCFINIITPERVSDFVIKRESDKILIESFYEQEESVVPAVASYCFGTYDLYYAKENPEIGINILKRALSEGELNSIVAEDLGYILRDEGRIQESIDAFLISESCGPTSQYIYHELAELYKQINMQDKYIKYKEMFEKDTKNGLRGKISKVITKILKV